MLLTSTICLDFIKFRINYTISLNTCNFKLLMNSFFLQKVFLNSYLTEVNYWVQPVQSKFVLMRRYRLQRPPLQPLLSGLLQKWHVLDVLNSKGSILNHNCLYLDQKVHSIMQISKWLTLTNNQLIVVNNVINILYLIKKVMDIIIIYG